MIEFDITIVPQGQHSFARSLCHIQIINLSCVADVNKTTFQYEVRVCDNGHSTYRSTTFRHTRSDDLFVLINKAMKALLKANIFHLRRIPESEYVVVDGDKYITMDLVRKYHIPDEVNRFCKFMTGQTSCIHGMFPCDYERWLRQGKLPHQTLMGFD